MAVFAGAIGARLLGLDPFHVSVQDAVDHSRAGLLAGVAAIAWACLWQPKTRDNDVYNG
jgi:hypothetical protein